MKANSLEVVYRYHMNDLYHYLLRLSGQPQTAEDLVQDTFIKAYEHLEIYQGENVRPWLFRAAHNAYIDWRRKERRHIHTDPALMEAITEKVEPGPEELFLMQEKIAGWFKIIETLPERSRHIILLRDYHDFTYQEIAYILGESLTNVKVKLYRARQRVKEVMKNEM
ncbi:MAG: sigma-70 family RNA polymerase sigma factor [Desulfotomaculaceae bacterium]|nr:sigma-70 family RNA polymerase sigma factor [Desulfotomaculaceae bacterium]